MRVEKLIIRNIGKIAQETINLNMPLIVLYGQIQQGKSTFLNTVRWLCGAPTPMDIIRHGQREASIELRFKGGSISRRWYIGQDGSTKADSVLFIRDGKKVPSPAAEIRKLMNPFLLNQDHLRDMGEADRKKFFTELFAIDTTDLDIEATDIESTAKDLRGKIKGYGDIDLTEVKPVDVVGLRKQLADAKAAHAEGLKGARAELAKVVADHAASVNETNKHNQVVRDHNATVARGIESSLRLKNEILELEDRLAAKKLELTKVDAWLASNQNLIEKNPPMHPNTRDLEDRAYAQPDTADLEAKIAEGLAQQVRVEQYQRNKARDAQRQADIDALKGYETRLRDIKATKIAKLKDVSDSCGIPDLSFDEDGGFIYRGTSAGMLSTSEIMQLSSELSSKFPDGIGIELVDRAESLGKSVFKFVERAKAGNLTILATFVGERPAEVPEEVGVFIVEDGKLVAEPSEEEAVLA